MIQCPRLKTFLTVFPISANTWGLKGGSDETWRMKLTDARAVRAFAALLPYLDGRTPTPDILHALDADGVHAGAAQAVLRQLEASSLLEESDPGGLTEEELAQFDDQIRFFSRFTQAGGAKYQRRLFDSRAAILGDGALAESMYGRLARAGFGSVAVVARDTARVRGWINRASSRAPRTAAIDLDPDAVWPGDAGELPQIVIVCQEAHDPLLLEAMDALSKRAGVPWLLVRNLDMQEGWVGPLFVPGETASYLSLQARLRANMPGYAEYTAFESHVRAGEPSPPCGGLAPTFDLLTSIAAIEVIKFLTEVKVPELLGRFVTINLWTWDTEIHEVLRLPALDRAEPSRPAVYPWTVAGA